MSKGLSLSGHPILVWHDIGIFETPEKVLIFLNNYFFLFPLFMSNYVPEVDSIFENAYLSQVLHLDLGYMQGTDTQI